MVFKPKRGSYFYSGVACHEGIGLTENPGNPYQNPLQ